MLSVPVGFIFLPLQIQHNSQIKAAKRHRKISFCFEMLDRFALSSPIQGRSRSLDSFLMSFNISASRGELEALPVDGWFKSNSRC